MFQIYMLSTRMNQLRFALYDIKRNKNSDQSKKNPPELFLWDRSMIGDYIFAFWFVVYIYVKTDKKKKKNKKTILLIFFFFFV